MAHHGIIGGDGGGDDGGGDGGGSDGGNGSGTTVNCCSQCAQELYTLTRQSMCQLPVHLYAEYLSSSMFKQKTTRRRNVGRMFLIVPITTSIGMHGVCSFTQIIGVFCLNSAKPHFRQRYIGKVAANCLLYLVITVARAPALNRMWAAVEAGAEIEIVAKEEKERKLGKRETGEKIEASL